ncbi:MAG: helix-turn-helix domain-containing protein [Chloroflexi bacterium]|jgi:hypothetical protein|nr:helix-turn-helix domain-containing protein [Chloroflexota bacterium]
MKEAAAALRTALRFAQRDLPPTTARVDGLTLALYRVASGVTGSEVAGHLNVSKQYVSRLETEGAVVRSAGTYRAAVDMLAAAKAQAAKGES